MFTEKFLSMRAFVILMLLVSLSFGGLVFAKQQEPNTQTTLFEMSLEELMNVKVEVASKKKEKISEAPGIVTIVTREEIEAFGSRSLGQLLDLQPSIAWVDGDDYRGNTIYMRAEGDKVLDNHVLLLLDGRPLKETNFGGWTGLFYHTIPLDAVDHIEIIRGPGSVLYGTNAFAGVINIVTRKTDKPLIALSTITYGSFDTFSQQGTVIGDSNGFEYLVSLNNQDNTGKKFGFYDPSGTYGEDDFRMRYTSTLASLAYKGFSCDFFATDYDPHTMGFFNGWSGADGHTFGDIRHYHTNLGYDHKIFDDLNISANATLNFTKIPGTSSGDPLAQSFDGLYELTLSGNLTDKLDIVAGGSFESNRYKGSAVIPGTIKTLSGYAQFGYKMTDWLKLIAGGQLNKVEDIKANFSPRLGTIINFNKKTGVKLLYSNAFRSPYPLEIAQSFYLFTPSSVAPETIDTYEAQLFYEGERLNGSITGYYSRIKDVIGIDTLAGGQYTYINTPGVEKFYGVELEGKYLITKGLKLIGSATYQQNKGPDGTEQYMPFPTFMGKAGLIYEEGKTRIGLFNRYLTAFPGADHRNSSALVLNPKPDDFYVLDLNIEHDISDWFGRKDKSITLSFKGENLLGEKAYFTHPLDSVNSLPLSTTQGRAFFVSLKVLF